MAFCNALHGAGPGRGAADEVEERRRWRACQHLRTLWELTNAKGCAHDKAAFQLLQKKRDLTETDAKTPTLTTSLFIPTLLMLPMKLPKQIREKVAIVDGYDRFTIGLLSSIAGEYYIMVSTVCPKIASYGLA
ncbi:hypothetical protein CGLO_13341 [Colletotrichum gloeosporioides Cg-14]|uniref:Uncharacterized protein n=1 Tax=Colletotrichum gloeosporioides (strain Cg-14) TaxID=1237896 RepID=T0JWT4_COLGC|nr:hypothetical protein CGLO_13341 [Colletotrichum gloeosporioides Cg-14]